MASPYANSPASTRRPTQPSPYGPSLSPIPSSLRPSLFRARPSPLAYASQRTYPGSPATPNVRPLLAPPNSVIAPSASSSASRNPFQILPEKDFDDFVGSLTSRIRGALSADLGQDEIAYKKAKEERYKRWEEDEREDRKKEEEGLKDVFGEVKNVGETTWQPADERSSFVDTNEPQSTTFPRSTMSPSPPYQLPLPSPDRAPLFAPDSGAESLHSPTMNDASGSDEEEDTSEEEDEEDVEYEEEGEEGDEQADYSSMMEQVFGGQRQAIPQQNGHEDDVDADGEEDDEDAFYDEEEEDVAPERTSKPSNEIETLELSDSDEEDGEGDGEKVEEAGSQDDEEEFEEEEESPTSSPARRSVPSTAFERAETRLKEGLVDYQSDDEEDENEVEQDTEQKDKERDWDEAERGLEDSDEETFLRPSSPAQDDDSSSLGSRIPWEHKGKGRAATPSSPSVSAATGSGDEEDSEEADDSMAESVPSTDSGGSYTSFRIDRLSQLIEQREKLKEEYMTLPDGSPELELMLFEIRKVERSIKRGRRKIFAKKLYPSKGLSELLYDHDGEESEEELGEEGSDYEEVVEEDLGLGKQEEGEEESEVEVQEPKKISFKLPPLAEPAITAPHHDLLNDSLDSSAPEDGVGGSGELMSSDTVQQMARHIFPHAQTPPQPSASAPSLPENDNKFDEAIAVDPTLAVDYTALEKELLGFMETAKQLNDETSEYFDPPQPLADLEPSFEKQEENDDDDDIAIVDSSLVSKEAEDEADSMDVDEAPLPRMPPTEEATTLLSTTRDLDDAVSSVSLPTPASPPPLFIETVAPLLPEVAPQPLADTTPTVEPNDPAPPTHSSPLPAEAASSVEDLLSSIASAETPAMLPEVAADDALQSVSVTTSEVAEDVELPAEVAFSSTVPTPAVPPPPINTQVATPPPDHIAFDVESDFEQNDNPDTVEPTPEHSPEPPSPARNLVRQAGVLGLRTGLSAFDDLSEETQVVVLSGGDDSEEEGGSLREQPEQRHKLADALSSRAPSSEPISYTGTTSEAEATVMNGEHAGEDALEEDLLPDSPRVRNVINAGEWDPSTPLRFGPRTGGPASVHDEDKPSGVGKVNAAPSDVAQESPLVCTQARSPSPSLQAEHRIAKENDLVNDNVPLSSPAEARPIETSSVATFPSGAAPVTVAPLLSQPEAEEQEVEVLVSAEPVTLDPLLQSLGSGEVDPITVDEDVDELEGDTASKEVAEEASAVEQTSTVDKTAVYSDPTPSSPLPYGVSVMHPEDQLRRVVHQQIDIVELDFNYTDDRPVWTSTDVDTVRGSSVAPSEPEVNDQTFFDQFITSHDEEGTAHDLEPVPENEAVATSGSRVETDPTSLAEPVLLANLTALLDSTSAPSPPEESSVEATLGPHEAEQRESTEVAQDYSEIFTHVSEQTTAPASVAPSSPAEDFRSAPEAFSKGTPFDEFLKAPQEEEIISFEEPSIEPALLPSGPEAAPGTEAEAQPALSIPQEIASVDVDENAAPELSQNKRKRRTRQSAAPEETPEPDSTSLAAIATRSRSSTPVPSPSPAKRRRGRPTKAEQVMWAKEIEAKNAEDPSSSVSAPPEATFVDQVASGPSSFKPVVDGSRTRSPSPTPSPAKRRIGRPTNAEKEKEVLARALENEAGGQDDKNGVDEASGMTVDEVASPQRASRSPSATPSLSQPRRSMRRASRASLHSNVDEGDTDVKVESTSVPVPTAAIPVAASPSPSPSPATRRTPGRLSKLELAARRAQEARTAAKSSSASTSTAPLLSPVIRQHHHRHSPGPASSSEEELHPPVTRSHCDLIRITLRSKAAPSSPPYEFLVPSCALASSLAQETMKEFNATIDGPAGTIETLAGARIGGGGLDEGAAHETGSEGEKLLEDEDVRVAIRRVLGNDLYNEGVCELLPRESSPKKEEEETEPEEIKKPKKPATRASKKSPAKRKRKDGDDDDSPKRTSTRRRIMKL